MDGTAQARQGLLVLVQDLAVAAEVVLLEGGGSQDGFGVEEAGELGDEGLALGGEEEGLTAFFL